MEASAGGVRILSRRLVRPEPARSPHGEPLLEPETMHLTPWDLQYISVNYIQKGVLLPKSPALAVADVAEDLASSFARALSRFYPLAGRLAVTGSRDCASGTGLTVSLLCNDHGAEFVHAVAPEVTASEITVTAPLHFPPVLRSFFPLDGLLCGDAILDSTRAVLAAQVTELADGVFVALSLNHTVADGTAFWHFFNTWSEISRSACGHGCKISTPPPVLDRWFPDTCTVPVTLPVSELEELIRRVELPPVKECFFHFSAESVRNLKAKANAEMAGTAPEATISSLQAVLAHLWRAACRAWGLSPDRETTCLQAVGCRGRVKGVAEYYMGCAVAIVVTASTAGHVQDKGLGSTALRLNRIPASFDEAEVKESLKSWHREPKILYLEASGDPANILMASSPRFDVYGNDFGWGAPVAVRSGAGNKMDGVVTVYEGRSGGGSMEMEMCMSPESLARLVADSEFMEAVSTARE